MSSQRIKAAFGHTSQRNKPNYIIIILNMLKKKIFISPIPRKGILAGVNCQLLVDSYEMEIDSAEH